MNESRATTLATADTTREVPTLEQLLARLDEIAPVLERNGERTEAERRVAEENITPLI